ncbi:hypothetical protein [Methylibium petroleiphilum]|uniref:hypothetical protein n=1 Tax=Methylibium petroleiphilum TaxID=105560 RepID=UPI0003236A2B|nr:hypothetical protein [Methylibium petroleiphilum]
MSGDMMTYLVMAGILLILLMCISFFRTLISGIFSRVLTPSIAETLKVVMKWILFLMKRLMRSHTVLIKNLLSPHSVVYPTLQRPSAGKKTKD